MNKRFLSLLMALCLLLAALPALAEEPLPITMYLYDPCGACAGVRGCGECKIEIAMANRLGILLRERIDEKQIAIRYRNVRDLVVDGQYREHMASLGLEDRIGETPAILVGQGEYLHTLFGEASIDELPDVIDTALAERAALGAEDDTPPAEPAAEPEEEEPEAVTLPRNDSPLSIREDDSVVLYFYKDDCPYCVEIKALIHAIPEEVTLPDGTTSTVRFIALNKHEPAELAVVEKYYELLEVPEDRQFVPAIILGERDLFLYDEIVPGLLSGLLAGEGQHTPVAPLFTGEDESE